MKRLLCLILTLSLMLSACAVLSACGSDCEHVDKNKNGECDECGEAMSSKGNGDCQHVMKKVKAVDATCTEKETRNTTYAKAAVNISLILREVKKFPLPRLKLTRSVIPIQMVMDFVTSAA